MKDPTSKQGEDQSGEENPDVRRSKAKLPERKEAYGPTASTIAVIRLAHKRQKALLRHIHCKKSKTWVKQRYKHKNN